MTHDVNQREINFSYKSRGDSQFYVSVAHTLIRLFRQVKGGVLVFVPAYSVLNQMKKVWRQHKLFKEFSKDRECFIEDQN